MPTNFLGVDGDSAGSSAGLELNEGAKRKQDETRAATKMPGFFHAPSMKN